MSHISTATTSAREAARAPDGRFGSFTSPEAGGVDLSTSLEGASCARCAGEVVIERDGVSHHLDPDGCVDHDADADHVALDDAPFSGGGPPLAAAPELTDRQAHVMDGMAGDFRNGYDEADVDYALSQLSDQRTELVCVWEREDSYGATGHSQVVGRVDGGPWRSLGEDAAEYLHDTGYGLPERLLSNQRFERQDVEHLNKVTPYNATIEDPAA